MPLNVRHELRVVMVTLAVALSLGGCQAQDGGLTATDAVYRAPLGSSDVGVAYVTLRSGAGDRVVGVSSPAARVVEMHETVSEGGRSRMQRVDSLDLPAGEEVRFESGGLHLMVISPQAPPESRPGERGEPATFPIQFQLESGETRTIRFEAGAGPLHRE